MKRLLTWVSVSALTFFIGLSLLPSMRKLVNHEPTAPLQLTISDAIDPNLGHIKLVTIKNMSKVTVRGYALGYTCEYTGTDIDGRPYPDNTCYTNPGVDHQVLRPGETQQLPVPANNLVASGSKAVIWVDLVHFDGGGPNWGENKGHKDSYVR